MAAPLGLDFLVGARSGRGAIRLERLGRPSRRCGRVAMVERRPLRRDSSPALHRHAGLGRGSRLLLLTPPLLLAA